MKRGAPSDDAMRTQTQTHNVRGILMENGRLPTEFTIFSDDDCYPTEWVSAVGDDSFVSLEEMM